MISNHSFWTGLLVLVGCLYTSVVVVVAEEPELDEQSWCETGPDALTNEFGKLIPQTCIDVPVDDGSTTISEERCYYTYVPESCYGSAKLPADNKVPLVMDLHGISGCAKSSASYTGWMQKADEECIVMVWPSGQDNPLVERCFNVPGFAQGDGNDVTTFPCCCLAENGLPSTETPDPLFLKMAIDSVIDSFERESDNTEDANALSIDADRIYMAGHSNGCIAALAMAALYSDTVAAVCCHSGTISTPFPTTTSDDNYTPVPIWLAHGMKDPTIPYDGAVFMNLPGIGNVGTWSVDQVTDYLAKQNECVDEEKVDVFAEDNATETIGFVTKRSNCKRNANVEVLSLYEGTHHLYRLDSFWQEILNFGEDALRVDTTALAWEFCSSHSKSLPAVEEEDLPAVEEEEEPVVDKDTDDDESENEDSAPAGSSPPSESSAPSPYLWNGKMLLSSLMSIVVAVL